MPIRVDPRLTIMTIIAVVGLSLLACTSPAPSPTPTEAMVSEPTAAQVAEATSTPAEMPSEEIGELTFNLVEGQNEARYLAEEQLARIGFNIAVGKTKDVTGAIVIRTDGTIVPDQSKILVDLRSLTSDSDRRDGYIQRSTLNTAQFPHAELVLTEAKGLSDPLPTSGEVDFQLVGDLTVRGRPPCRRLGMSRHRYPARN